MSAKAFWARQDQEKEAIKRLHDWVDADTGTLWSGAKANTFQTEFLESVAEQWKTKKFLSPKQTALLHKICDELEGY